MFYLLYPVLCAALPPLALYAKNSREIEFGRAAVLLVLSASFPAVVFLLLTRAVGLSPQAAAATAFAAVICFYTPWYKWKRLKSRYFYQHAVKFALYAAVAWLIWRVDGVLPAVLSAVFAGAAIILAANIRSGGKPASGNCPAEESLFPADVSENDKPDIYHIVFDAYAGPAALKLAGGFDNGEFYRKLKSMGFRMTDNAYSNYNHTSASLSSVANMGYTRDFLTEKDFSDPAFIRDNQHYRFLYVLKSKLVKGLKSLGYRIITTGEPLFGDFCLNNCADIIDSVGCSQKRILKNSLYANFFKTTVLGGVFAAGNANMKAHALYIKEIMDYAGNIPQSESPFYSFVHVWAPHAPYCFNEDGSLNGKFADIGDVASDDAETRNAYVSHLKYLNVLMENTLESLAKKIRARGRKAVVLIHGDHGVFKTESPLSEYNVLLGVYTFGFEDREIFPDTVSLVNVFPYILRHCFGHGPEIKDDRYFYENWHISCYNEREITVEMKKLTKRAADDGNN